MPDFMDIQIWPFPIPSKKKKKKGEIKYFENKISLWHKLIFQRRPFHIGVCMYMMNK